jgi:hypothetical protein
MTRRQIGGVGGLHRAKGGRAKTNSETGGEQKPVSHHKRLCLMGDARPFGLDMQQALCRSGQLQPSRCARRGLRVFSRTEFEPTGAARLLA